MSIGSYCLHGEVQTQGNLDGRFLGDQAFSDVFKSFDGMGTVWGRSTEGTYMYGSPRVGLPSPTVQVRVRVRVRVRGSKEEGSMRGEWMD